MSSSSSSSQPSPVFALHSSWYSTHGQKPLFAAEEAKVAFTVVPVNFFAGESLKAAYRAKNPLGVIPALELLDGTGRVLGESRPIAKFIAENFAESTLYPKGPNGWTRAKIDEWVSFEQENTTPLIFDIVNNTMFSQISQRKADEGKLDAAVKNLGAYLNYLEKSLKGKSFLVNDTFSLADVNFAPELFNLSQTPFKTLIDERPNVSAWLNRVWNRPTWQKIVKNAAEQTPKHVEEATKAGGKLNITVINSVPRNVAVLPEFVPVESTL